MNDYTNDASNRLDPASGSAAVPEGEERTITRRALLKTGWVAPVVLAVGLSGWTANVSTAPDPEDPTGDAPQRKSGMQYFGQMPDHPNAGQSASQSLQQNDELRGFVRGLRGKQQ